jgi:hypothetical protein
MIYSFNALPSVHSNISRVHNHAHGAHFGHTILNVNKWVLTLFLQSKSLCVLIAIILSHEKTILFSFLHVDYT